MSESTIMLAVKDDLVHQVHADITISGTDISELTFAINRLSTPASVYRFLNRFSFIMEFEMVTTSLQEDFEAEQSAQKFFTPVTSRALTAKSGGQGDMVDATSMAHPWKVAEDVTVAERKAAFDSSVCPNETRSQSGAIEEGVEDDLPGNFTPKQQSPDRAISHLGKLHRIQILHAQLFPQRCA
jgi:hypothetical protein